MAKRGVSFAVLAMLVLLSAQLALAAGSLKGTFKYKDPATGTEQILEYGFVYLHSASKPPPMEKFFSKADVIVGITTGNPFIFNNIPEGTYYVRLLQRKVIGGATAPYGPPQEGDYTWFQTAPITIPAGGVYDLGTRYATPFGSAPISITGILTSQNGTPVAGQYVRAQTVPCTTDGQNFDVNQCGPVKLLAEAPTDSNGKYTMFLRDSGTYYIYASPCLTTAYDAYTGNRCGWSTGPGPVKLSVGDSKTLNFSIWVP